MTQIHADENSKNNLRPSAKSADKKRRFDIVLLVNGVPLVIGEAKTPVRPAVTWVDGASDIHNGYEQSVPQMFVPGVLSFATEGKCYRYGSVRMPIDIWGPWHNGENKATLPLHFEAVDVKLHIKKDAIDEAYSQMTDELSELDRDDLAKRAAKMAVLIKAPARVNARFRRLCAK